jgi:hypothetical protein
MNLFFTLKKTITATLLFLTMILFLGSCQKSPSLSENPTVIAVLPDLTTKVTSSVSGFVTDENETAVQNANVLIGTSTTTTDKYGYFEANNIQMIQNAAVVTVTKTGYFKGIKTYIATANKAAFFRIKLMPKTNAGTVNGTTGGVVTMTNGLGISFPASAVVNAATNAAYTGTVNVAAFYINPTAADIDRIMPGDLRGINTTGNLQILTSYGMAAVELTGASGELLQIATGKKATLSTPIPTALAATAPNTIPLWSFDEAKGLWKEEGTATKIGNKYVGDVSHFSFWNCDVPNNYVQFNCTVVNTTGQPLQNVRVKISSVNNLGNNRVAYTDAAGYVSGAVPSNQQLLLEVLGTSNCTNVILSQNFTTTTVNVNYGNIVINSATNIANIIGTVTNCSGAPVTNGYVIMQNGTYNSRYALSATGTYAVPQLLCGTNAINFTIFAEDASTSQQGNPVVYPIITGNNNIPAIQACGLSTAKYIYTTINGVASNFIVPTDIVAQSPDSLNTGINFYSQRIPYNQNSFLNIAFNNTGIAVGSTQNLQRFNSPAIPFNSTFTSPIAVNITEYGAIGQYIAGNFSGSFTGSSPSNTPYNVTCNFRIKRDY